MKKSFIILLEIWSVMLICYSNFVKLWNVIRVFPFLPLIHKLFVFLIASPLQGESPAAWLTFKSCPELASATWVFFIHFYFKISFDFILPFAPPWGEMTWFSELRAPRGVRVVFEGFEGFLLYLFVYLLLTKFWKKCGIKLTWNRHFVNTRTNDYFIIWIITSNPVISL